jgi:hypothetical protein
MLMPYAAADYAERPAADLSTGKLCAESIAEARNNEVGIATR